MVWCWSPVSYSYQVCGAAQGGDISDRACAILGGVRRTCCHGSFYPIHTGERVMLPTLMRRVYFFYCGSRAVLQWYDAPRVTHRPAELLVATNQDSTLSDSPPLLFLFKDSSSYSRLPPPSSSPWERDSHSPILPMLHKLKLILLKASLNFLPSAIPLHLVTPTFSYFHIVPYSSI